MEKEDFKELVHDIVISNPGTELIRKFYISYQTGTGFYNGFLIVNKNTHPLKEGEEITPISFPDPEKMSSTVVCSVSPQEYLDIINCKLPLPELWRLGDVIFDGTLTFTDIDSLIKSIRKWNYAVAEDDDVLNMFIGYKCASGLKWRIRLSDYKTSFNDSDFSKSYGYTSLMERERVLTYLNTKAPYKTGVEA